MMKYSHEFITRTKIWICNCSIITALKQDITEHLQEIKNSGSRVFENTMKNAPFSEQGVQHRPADGPVFLFPIVLILSGSRVPLEALSGCPPVPLLLCPCNKQNNTPPRTNLSDAFLHNAESADAERCVYFLCLLLPSQ